MRKLLILFLVGITAWAQDISVKAKVTYISSGTVYVSAGRSSGLMDSMLVYVVAGKDMTATMKVFAVSSKSSACTVLNSKREIVVGDNVVGIVPRTENKDVAALLPADTASGEKIEARRSTLPQSVETRGLVVQGRVSLQYYTALFDNSAYNLSQPGLIVSMRVASRDLPLTMEMYGNLRSVSRGGMSPFSSDASNESRIYRLSLEYDDQANVVTFGRILSLYAPSIGSIDGVQYARRFGNFITGGSIGFQPTLSQQGISTETKKMSLFARYEKREFYNLSITTAYARTYVSSQLDREAVSLALSAYSSDGLSVYGYSDVDLRTKNDNRFEVSPTVSSALFMVNYRVAYFLTLGIGADASRPVYPFVSVQSLPDSMLDHTLRSGSTLSLNLSLANGLGWYNTYTPRSSDAGFGKDYTNYSSLYWSNAFSSGVTIRATHTLTSNSFTTARGYGVNIQRNILGLDLSMRYQQSTYDIVQLGESNLGQTYGADIMTLLTSRVSWVMSFDAIRGYGSTMNAVFTELSWRF